MKAWTDYPFTWLGDVEGEKAPVREIEVLSYDGDKYCRVKVCGGEDEIKSGYIYQQKGRYGEVPVITQEQLTALENNVHNEKPLVAIIEHWQLHTLAAKAPKEYNIKTDKVYMFTGTVKEVYSGPRKVGDHMRSSVILTFDKETGEVETQNSKYILVGKGGDDVMPDLGPGVMSIFY